MTDNGETTTPTHERLPIRLLIQVGHDGVHNLLHEFDVRKVGPSKPVTPGDGAADGAKVRHEVSKGDLVAGLFEAQAKLMKEALDAPDTTPEMRRAWTEWFVKMQNWARASIGR